MTQSPDRLFTFFGCFGDVIRVKIMFRKQDTALIQFVDEVHVSRLVSVRVLVLPALGTCPAALCRACDCGGLGRETWTVAG